MPQSLLLTGGARSGKSRQALAWAEGFPGPGRLIATARRDPGDAEMVARIDRHRAERDPARWTADEEPLDLAAAVARAAEARAGCAVIDCVTLWLANLGDACGWDAARVLAEVDSLARVVADPPLPLCLVTNEVGSGIVPDNALARGFRDLQGFANQRLAAAAQRVVLVVCGLPLTVKTTA